jgi:hypothetical protein
MIPVRRWITFAAFVAMATTIGCGAFSALDGFSGGAEPDSGEAIDGARATNDAPSAANDDATSPGPDAGSNLVDADVDADPCVVSGMTTRICDGFERSMGVLLSSTPEAWTNSGNAKLVSGSMGGQLAHFAAGDDAGNNDAFLSFSAGTSVRRTAMRGRIRILTAPNTSARQILAVKFNSATDAQVTLSVGVNSALTLTEQVLSGSGANHAAGTMPSGWHSFALVVDLIQNRVEFTIDNVSALPSGEAFPVLPDFPTTGTVSMSIGARYSNVTPLTETEFDDVLLATATQ